MFAFPLRVFGPAPHLPQPCNPLGAVTRRFLLSPKSEIPAPNHRSVTRLFAPQRPTQDAEDRESESERAGEKTETLVVFLLDLTPGRSHEAISPPGGGIRGTTSWDGLLAVLGLQQRGGRGRA